MSILNSNENKRVLWNLLYEGGVFHGIAAEHLEDVKSIFEENISIIANEHESTNSNVTELNKQVMQLVITALNPLRNRREDRFNGRKDKLNERELNNRKKEFDSLLQPPTPKKIDFSDDSGDKPIGEEMDTLLSQTIANRERELNMVVSKQDIKVGEEWIGTNKETSDTSNKSPPMPTSTPHGQPIKINKANVDLDIVDVESAKKVKFADIGGPQTNENELSEFLKELSKESLTSKNDPEDSILHEVKALQTAVIFLERKIDKILEIVSVRIKN
jgi:hypothetical protein